MNITSKSFLLMGYIRKRKRVAKETQLSKMLNNVRVDNKRVKANGANLYCM